MKMYLKNTSLIFGNSHFHGGRMDKKGDGVVEVCFEWNKELNETLALETVFCSGSVMK